MGKTWKDDKRRDYNIKHKQDVRNKRREQKQMEELYVTETSTETRIHRNHQQRDDRRNGETYHQRHSDD